MSEQQDRLTSRLLAAVDALRRHPVRTMWVGITVQAVAVGVAGGAVWHETRRETAAAEATKYLWRLGWHDALHREPWLGLMLGCLLLYVVGALLFAMRFAPHHARRILGIMVVLLAGLAVLGCVIVVAVLIIAALNALGIDVPDGVVGGLPDSGWRRRRTGNSDR